MPAAVSVASSPGGTAPAASVTEAANPLATAPTARCVEKFATPVSRLDEADDRRFASAERRSREFDHRHLQMLAQKLIG
jgi:hypothetical protein